MIGRGFIKAMGTNFVSPWWMRPKIFIKEIGKSIRKSNSIKIT